jgi:hypothetical protein
MSAPHEKKLSDLEKLLAALPPRPSTLDRDHLLFRAGQASMRRSWAWPLAAVAMSTAAGCLAMILVLRPLPEPVVQIVHVQVPLPVPAPHPAEAQPNPPQAAPAPGYLLDAPAPTMSYLRLRQQALRFGVESLPEAATSDDEASAATASPGPDISAGSRPSLINPFSLLSFGVP